MAFMAGTARVNITPPVGVELSGQGVYLGRKSTGIHDELFCRALILDSGSERAVLLSADLIAFGAELVSECRNLIERQTGIKAENVMLSATHTHNGPATCFMRGWGEMDQDYLRMLPRYVAGAVTAALNNMRQVRVGFGTGNITTISYNRSRSDGPIDPQLGVMRMDEKSGNVLSYVVNFSAHPTVMANPQIRLISSCIPFYAVRTIEDSRNCTVCYTTGASGDINSTYTWEGQGRLRDIGSVLLSGILDVSGSISMAEEPELTVRSKRIELPLNMPYLKEVENALSDYENWFEKMMKERRHLESDRNGWKRFYKEYLIDTVEKIKRKTKDTITAELQVIRVGDCVLVALPCELFVEFGLAIKKRSPFRYTFVVTYANGYIGYIPDEAEFLTGGYAATLVPQILGNFPFASNVGSILVEEVLTLLPNGG
jgi:hypothetical protein